MISLRQWRRHTAATIIVVVLVGAAGCRTTTPPQVTLPPSDQPAPDSTRAPTGMVPAAAISGFVADAASGEPLEGALVVPSAIDRDDQRIALTDDRDYYELIQLPRLDLRRAGLVNRLRGPSTPPAPVAPERNAARAHGRREAPVGQLPVATGGRHDFGVDPGRG